MQTLELRNVNKIFGPLQVLNDINIKVDKGEFAAIVGPSGCGKSTALRMFAGLETASSGDVLVDGQPISQPSPSRMLIFQEHALYPWSTVEQNVGLGLEISRIPKKERLERINAVLDKVNLTGFNDYFPSQLSGGMRQRVAIARALIMDPDVLLLDEPYGALDAMTRLQMQNELLRLWEGSGKTMLLITHDIDEALYLADKVYVMSARPGQMTARIDLELPRPRNRNGERFVAYRQEIMSLLGLEE
jgi:ABC-type nitrate/sulfonate/bicarbonate transport system ATPase subunit